MADIEQTVADQPQESTQDHGHHDFLGVNPTTDLGESEPSTSPEDEQTGESAEPEVEAEGEQQSVEDSDDWLPTEQEKEFPPEVLAKYAKRYGYTPDEIATDPRVARIVKDKINSDILIQQQKAAVATAEEEPPSEEAEPETAAEVKPEAERQQYEQFVDQVVSTFDPQAVQKFGKALWEGLGGTEEQLKDAGVDLGKLGSTLARANTDLMFTALPAAMERIFDQIMERRYPEFGAMHENAMYARQWETVRATKAPDGSQPYAKMPDYGTPEFSQLMRQAAEQVPGFDQMVFRSKNGAVLPMHEQARQKYSLLAKIAAGQNVNALPAVKQAVETGKKLAKEADRSRQNAKILGAGQSTRQFTPASGSDPLDEAIARQRAQTAPFAQPKR